MSAKSQPQIDSVPDSTRSPASPQLGFNSEIEHKGRPFHVQTEDSGIDHPRVVTHLFAGGGRVIATRKSDYSACVGTTSYPHLVKELILIQHRDMCARLRSGEYDDLIASLSSRPQPREESPFDLEAVEALAKRRRERATSSAESAREVAPPSRAPAPAAVESLPASSVGQLDASQVVLFEDVPSSASALDELIAEHVASHLTKDE